MTKTEPLPTLLIIPTGIGCDVGGYAGDAIPAARLLASASKCLITHPNVMNGGSLYWPDPHIHYVEGYSLNLFVAGELFLKPVRQQKVRLLLDARIESDLKKRHLQVSDGCVKSLVIDIGPIITTETALRINLKKGVSGSSWGKINEPDVSPLQLQGPNSAKIMQNLFGDEILDLKYYWLREIELENIPLVVSRTGWSSEFGYELFLRDGSKGDLLWEKIMAAGKDFGLKPGHTSSIRRIEAAMLSYHADADIHTNPFEVGLDRLVSFDTDIDYVGKEALKKIKTEGIKRKQIGLILDCDPLKGPNTTFWEIIKDNKIIGKVTSAVYSPRLKKNIALAIISIGESKIGNIIDVKTSSSVIKGTIVEKPFFDPKKKIASGKI